MDYAYISFYFGDQYATDLREIEKKRQEQARALYEQQLQEVLDFQRNEFVEMLRVTQKDLLLGMSMGTVEMCHLLQMSRAFVYSYFDKTADKNYEL